MGVKKYLAGGEKIFENFVRKSNFFKSTSFLQIIKRQLFAGAFGVGNFKMGNRFENGENRAKKLLNGEKHWQEGFPRQERNKTCTNIIENYIQGWF